MESFSSAKPECSADEKVLVTWSQGQDNVQESRQSGLSTVDKYRTSSSVASDDVATLQKSSLQISAESAHKSSQQGHQSRCFGGSGASSRRESLHRRLSAASADHYRRTSPITTRSTDTRPGSSLSSESGRPERESRKDCSRTSSRHGSFSSSRSVRLESKPRKDCSSKSSSREHSHSRRECRDDVDKRSLERLRHCPGSGSDSQLYSSGRRESASQRVGQRRDQEYDGDRRKYESCGRSSGEHQKDRVSCQESDRNRRDCGSSSGEHRKTGRRKRSEELDTFSKVDRKQSEGLVGVGSRGALLSEDLVRLSVTASGSSQSRRVTDREEARTEYQAVLTRHVNQLFIRGDNVALVAIVS